jgi:hypothetical protein
MDRKNLIALSIILTVFFAINSFAQTVQREQLLSVNQKLDQYKIKQSTVAAGAFSLRDYYKSLELADIENRYGQVGVLADKTVQDSSAIQDDIARNLDNYENVRIAVRNKLSELRSTHDLAQRSLNETIAEVQKIRPVIQRPALLSAQEANLLASGSYQGAAVLHYSDAQTEITRAVTSGDIKSGLLPSIISSLPQGGTTFLEFNQSVQEVQQPPPTDIIPECTLRLLYIIDAVSGSDVAAAGGLVALGGSFKTSLPSCMFTIGSVSFYNIEPSREVGNNTLYCALPPGMTGQAESWVIGKGCRESEHVPFVVVVQGGLA